jgi:hypothetical protein
MMIKIFFKVTILFFIFTCTSSANESSFSFATKELNIPRVIVDENKYYAIKMTLTDEKEFVFSLAEANELPSFEERFETIQNNMSRPEVLNILGVPQKIQNLEKKELEFCSEPSIESGTAYEQFEYAIDSNSDGASGFVVWFAKVDNTAEWKVIDKIKGFSCM